VKVGGTITPLLVEEGVVEMKEDGRRRDIREAGEEEDSGEMVVLEGMVVLEEMEDSEEKEGDLGVEEAGAGEVKEAADSSREEELLQVLRLTVHKIDGYVPIKVVS